MNLKVKASKSFQNLVIQMVREISIIKVKFWTRSGSGIKHILFCSLLISHSFDWELAAEPPEEAWKVEMTLASKSETEFIKSSGSLYDMLQLKLYL